MRIYAIIIGIDEYKCDLFFPSLRTPVANATALSDWLGSRFQLKKKILLLSPRPGGPAAVQADGEGTFGSIIAKLDKLRSDIVTSLDDMGDEDRLFFYFAGHGAGMLPPDKNTAKSFAIFPSDWKQNERDAFDVDWITRSFKSVPIRHQIFVFDCCRDFRPDLGEPYRKSIKPPIRELGKDVNQYILYSTSPEYKAVDEHETFTELLTRFLSKGWRRARRWDPASGSYQVPIGPLWEEIVAEFKRRQEAAKVPPNDANYQVPQAGSEFADPNLVLSYLSPLKDVLPIDLSLTIGPAAELPSASVRIRDTSNPPPPPAQQPSPKDHLELAVMPLKIPLLPNREYEITVLWRRGERSWTLNFDEDTKPIVVILGPPAVATGGPGGPGGPPGAGEVAMAGPGGPGRTGAAEPGGGPGMPEGQAPGQGYGPARRAELSVMMNESLAAFEISDLTGRRRQLGQEIGERDLGDGNKEVAFGGLGEGPRRVKFWSPGATPYDEVVNVERRSVARPLSPVVPDLPPHQAGRLVDDMVEAGGYRLARWSLDPDEPDRIGPAPLVGEPLVAPRASSCLAFANLASDPRPGRPNREDRFHELGLKGFADEVPAAVSGVQVLVAFGLHDRDRARAAVANLAFRVWRMDEAAPEARPVISSPKVAGLASFSTDLPPGSYWLSAIMPGGKETVFAVTVLEGTLTGLIFDMDARAQFHPVWYFHPVRNFHGVDPRLANRRELLQRFLIDKQISPSRVLADQKADPGPSDPIEGSISCYLLALDGKFDRLRDLSRRMAGLFPKMSDFHVVNALVEERRGDRKSAEESFATALEAGLPMLGYWLDRLYGGTESYKITDKHRHGLSPAPGLRKPYRELALDGLPGEADQGRRRPQAGPPRVMSHGLRRDGSGGASPGFPGAPDDPIRDRIDDSSGVSRRRADTALDPGFSRPPGPHGIGRLRGSSPTHSEVAAPFGDRGRGQFRIRRGFGERRGSDLR